MAKRGRKAAAPGVKIFRETRKDRVQRGSLKAPKGLPTRPAYLDEEGAAEWDRMVELLSPLGVLSPLDGPALGNYCRLFSVALKAENEIATTGMVTSETAMGSDKQNPAVQVLIAATAQMNKLLVEFGMTPASRASLEVGNGAPEDELGAFLAKKA